MSNDRDNLEASVWEATTALLRNLPRDLEACVYRAAVVHWFDQPILDVLAAAGEPRRMAARPADTSYTTPQLYEQLAVLPFVEDFSGRGLSLHDLTRHALIAHLWTEEQAFFRQVSALAADYFEGKYRSGVAEPDEIVELAYHKLVVDERAGVEFVEVILPDLAATPSSGMIEGLVDTLKEHVLAGRCSAQVAGYADIWVLRAALAGERFERARARSAVHE